MFAKNAPFSNWGRCKSTGPCQVFSGPGASFMTMKVLPQDPQQDTCPGSIRSVIWMGRNVHTNDFLI